MITAQQIIDKAHIILVDTYDTLIDELGKWGDAIYWRNADSTKAMKESVDNYLKDKVYLKVGDGNTEHMYHNWRDDHHYTTEYWYSILPEVCRYLNINYNRDDFDLQPNDEYSYLIPKTSPRFTIYANGEKEKKEEALLIYYPLSIQISGYYDSLIGESEFVFFSSQLSANAINDYHKLYKFPHVCSIIENMNGGNGRTLIISCNSHGIPLIPIFAYYYKKVICLDNRFANGENLSMGFMYENEDIDNVDSLLLLSYDNAINKFTTTNF